MGCAGDKQTQHKGSTGGGGGNSKHCLVPLVDRQFSAADPAAIICLCPVLGVAAYAPTLALLLPETSGSGLWEQHRMLQWQWGRHDKLLRSEDRKA